MCWFKRKKKQYEVKYTDINGKICFDTVEAINVVKACRIMEKRNPPFRRVRQILYIREVK